MRESSNWVTFDQIIERLNEFDINYSFKAASGKWPDNVAAINHVKAAFCLKIAKQLTEKCQLQARGNVNCVEVIKGMTHSITLN